jgi:hypothetical protein
LTEQRRLRIGVAAVALGTVQAGRIAPEIRARRALVGRAIGGDDVDVDAAAAALERRLDRLDRAHLLRRLDAKAVGDDVEHFPRPGRRRDLALGVDAGEAARREPLLDLLDAGRGGQLDREGDDQARLVDSLGAGRRARHQVGVDRLRRVVTDALAGCLVEQLGGSCEQQLQMVVELGHRADRRARAAHRVGLVDRDRRRHALDLVDRRAVHPLEELARVGAEGLDVAALALGVQRVEHQARLARAARPGHDRHFSGADVEIEVLEVVLSRAADADDAGGHRESLSPGERSILGRSSSRARRPRKDRAGPCGENRRAALRTHGQGRMQSQQV